MNKTGVALLSALLTAGVGVGSLAIMNQIPATSNMLNTAFGGDKQIIKEEIKVDNDFNSTLESKGLVLVNYILEDGIVTDIIQKGSSAEFYKKPVKDGYACIGWSTTPDGKNMVANVEESCDLYPVFASGDFQVIVHDIHGYMTYNNVADMRFTSLNYSGDGYDAGIGGLSKSPDSIELVSEIEPDTEYYGVFYFTTTGTLMSTNDADRYMDYMQYGEQGFAKATIHTVMNGDITDEIRNLFSHESVVLGDHYHYFTEGFTNSPDSTEVLYTSNLEFEENGEYYMVYSGYGENGHELLSYNQMKKKFDCIISCMSGNGNAVKYSDLAEYEQTFIQDGIEFRFVGWSDEYNSYKLVDTEDIIANNIKVIYAVYTREDTAEIYTTEQLFALRNDSVTRVYTYKTHSLFVHFLDKYEEDAIIDDVTYEFVGWSDSSASTDLIVGGMEEYKQADFIYAVYKDLSTGELLSQSAMEDMYNESRWN